MGKDCCDHQDRIFRPHASTNEIHRKLLWAVFWINVFMCAAELYGGWLARSSTIVADSLHLMTHVFVVALSLYALSRGLAWRARAAFVKGLLTAALGVSVLFETFESFRIARGVSTLPNTQMMGVIGLLALLANLACLCLLARHKNDDINMRSTWICSKNDLLTNLAILATSAAVAVSHSRWPDAVVGMLLAVAILHSSFHILKHSWAMLDS